MSELVDRLRKVAERPDANYPAIMEQAAARIEQLEEKLSIWKSVFPDIAPERVLPDRSLLEARVKQLEADNASLATWQCVFTDGKTGLVCGEHGDTYCAMAKRVEQLEKALQVIRQLPNLQHHYGTQITELIDATLEAKP